MSISGIGTGQSASLSLITGTSYSSDTSASSLMAEGQGLDEASISKGGQQMMKLAQLASSDPDKFKQAAREISGQLAEAAKDSSDSGESQALTDMASQWAEAAESGSMPTPPQAPSGAGQGAQGTQGALMKFKGQSGGGPVAVADSVISSVLTGMGAGTSSTSSTSSASSSSGASAGSYYSVASSSETAA